MYTVKKEIVRAPKELIDAFSELSTPLLADVMGRRNVMRHNMRPVYYTAKLCGSALTVQTYRSDNLMIHVGIHLSQPGDVLVVDAEGFCDAGHFGEIMATNAAAHGAVGMVIDGGVRDRDELEKMNFPVFSSGINACGTSKHGGGSVNSVISCGGVSVAPGDIVLADDCGVAVVPIAEAYEVLELARKKQKLEAEMVKRTAAGEDLLDIMNLSETLEKIGVKYI
jgi:4-hydroxy-4-methyl-2-oxoglutarate aldolase